jgi:sacsin
MAGWQGPALLCYNDAVFQPADFTAIARIGQDSKLEKPAATGRFGLGFNAVYHFTGEGHQRNS